MGFERLVYTDCLPGESLTGQAGFGFRAASGQAGPDVQEIVARQLLYEAPEEWMRRERPVEDYPPMLAHVRHRDWYCTASGSYLGRERKGNRQGNHLTEAICTRSAEQYRGLRPSQLAAAGLWLGADPGRSDLAPTGDDWPFTGPTADDAFATVFAADAWRECLATALTVLGDPESGRRLVVIGADLDQVLQWISAITLLLPLPQALRTAFKAFTTKPYFGDFDIVAIRPETAIGLHLAGAAVIDLEQGTVQGPEPGPVEQAWTDQLDHGDHLDLIDAIELAGDTGLLPTAAQELALAAFGRGSVTPASAGAVTSWLAGCPAERYRAYAEPIVASVLEIPDRPHRLLVELDRLAVKGRLVTGSAGIRLDLLDEELRIAQGGTPASVDRLEPLPARTWNPEAAEAARTAVVEALRTGGPAGFEAVLRVADRFDLDRIDLNEEAPEALGRFLAAWTRRPEESVESSYRDLLRAHLLADIDRRYALDAEGLAAVADRWHRHLLTWFRPLPVHSRTYRACLAAAGSRATDVGLQVHLDGLLRNVSGDDLAAAASALFERTPVSPEAMRRLLDARPNCERFGSVLTDRLLVPELTGSVGEAALAVQNLVIVRDRGRCGDRTAVPAVLEAYAVAAAGPASARQLRLLATTAPWLIAHLGERIIPSLENLDTVEPAIQVMSLCSGEVNLKTVLRMLRRLQDGSWRASHFTLAFLFSQRGRLPKSARVLKTAKKVAREMTGRQAAAVDRLLSGRPAERTDFHLMLERVGNDDARAALRNRRSV